jgi:hypothetical protein
VLVLAGLWRGDQDQLHSQTDAAGSLRYRGRQPLLPHGSSGVSAVSRIGSSHVDDRLDEIGQDTQPSDEAESFAFHAVIILRSKQFAFDRLKLVVL